VLLVDETSIRRRRRYVTVILNADTNKTLAVAPHLRKLFDAHRRLEAGWKAPQELHGLYRSGGRQGALEALGRFCDLYETGEPPEFHDIATTIISWSEEILARHRAGRPSNGRIEGANNLLQALRRTAHGFTNTANFEARGLLTTRPANRCPQPHIPRKRAAPVTLPCPHPHRWMVI